ncbi:MAG: NAD-dependent succinate-semialdehyde dehydrogenase [Thaumarchaeota archaeon]|nr:NAD-dependent succinate-semialdehyde dehydrogenase [Nitrososphaerota archaeon]MDE1817983.1 NAD-dependent succinate-semialdehyde dehydrogenase [Nitrososphaerota archaeon]MDE1876321.1 NAD-dependent succinate-semialdehyde dehydrogenase [Nitrososphaerota archaeon]
MLIKTINPATEEVIAEYQNITEADLKNKVAKSREAFSKWKTNSKNRAVFLHILSENLRKNKESLAKVATQEMGKPLKESLAEVEKCAWAMEFYGDNGETFLNPEIINTDARKSFVAFQPIGVIASIMPWNFPYWQALRFAAPSLMAGNTIVLKPASVTMQCGIEMEKLFTNTGFPEGVFQTLVSNSSMAEKLIDSDINAVTFTGSNVVGAKVAQRATSQIKKCVLELGGSDPFIVCSDADVEKASTGAVKGRFINCGQSCIASKRFFVVKNLAKEFIEKFVQKVEKLNVGDPMSDTTDIGPLVNADGLSRIEEMVKDAVAKGAQILTGGKRLRDKGYFYAPTVLDHITQDMMMAHEEVFGPVAPVTIVEDEDEAIRLANSSQYGLGASIWTQNLDKAEKLSALIDSGMVAVNNVLVSDPRIPFGGVKQSGFGRELSKYGMLEFVNVKSVRYYDQLVQYHRVE